MATNSQKPILGSAQENLGGLYGKVQELEASAKHLANTAAQKADDARTSVPQTPPDWSSGVSRLKEEFKQHREAMRGPEADMHNGGKVPRGIRGRQHDHMALVLFKHGLPELWDGAAKNFRFGRSGG